MSGAAGLAGARRHGPCGPNCENTAPHHQCRCARCAERRANRARVGSSCEAPHLLSSATRNSERPCRPPITLPACPRRWCRPRTSAPGWPRRSRWSRCRGRPETPGPSTARHRSAATTQRALPGAHVFHAFAHPVTTRARTSSKQPRAVASLRRVGVGRVWLFGSLVTGAAVAFARGVACRRAAHEARRFATPSTGAVPAWSRIGVSRVSGMRRAFLRAHRRRSPRS